MDKITQKEKNDEISVIYKIFREIFSKAPTFLKDLSSESIDDKYKESIDVFIDFDTIDKCFQENKYCSITDVVKDMRLVFLNCYKFYGTKSDYTYKSLELEELLENQISCLNEFYKALADIKLTFKLLGLDGIPKSKAKYPKNCYNSILLKSVAHCHPERLKKEYFKMVCSSTDEENAYVLEELVCWEKEMHLNDHYEYIGSMWELPEIGNFLAIIFKKLNIDIVIPQNEIERMFLMPKESTTMGKVMSFLLMPIKEKCIFSNQIMPYEVWSGKLCNKLSEWYKVYHAKERNKVNVMNLLGIHPDFWAAVGDNNPLIENNYCELSYFVRVWLVKGLCDHITIKYKTINNIILNCNERQCTIWKNDLETEEYFYFKSMPDLRIYYYFIPYDQPNLEFLESEKIKEDIKNRDVLSNSGATNVFCSNSRVQPNGKHFRVIAESVQGLRAFLDELDTENSTVPDDLIEALEKFIKEIEPEECNLIVLNNNSKIKLFEDWKSYLERYQNEEDEALKSKKKESKPISPVIEEKIIYEKRKRSVVKPEYSSLNYVFDSDGCKSEIDEDKEDTEESFWDSNDSEEEWGAINQINNNLTKRISRLDELERNCIEQRKLANINKQNESIELQNNKKSVKNELVNEKLNIFDSNNMNTEMKMNNVSSVRDVLLIDSKKEEDKQILASNSQKHIVVDNKIDTTGDEVILLIDDEKEGDNVVSSEEVVLLTDDEMEEDNQIQRNCIEQRKLANINKQNESIELQNNKKSVKNELVNEKLNIFDSNNMNTEMKMNNVSSVRDVLLIDSKKEEDKQILASNSQKHIVVDNKINTTGDEVILLIDDEKEGDNDVSSEEIVLLTDDEKEEDNQILDVRKQKHKIDENINKQGPDTKKTKSNGLNDVEIITLNDDDDLNNEILKENNEKVSCTKSDSIESTKNDEVISIDDDEQIISDDDVQFVGCTTTAQSSKTNASSSLKNNSNKSQNVISKRKQITNTNYFKPQVPPINTNLPKLSPNISIMPANIRLPKEIQVTIVNRPQTTIPKYFNATKRAVGSKGYHINKSKTVNVKCKVLTKSSGNDGEVKFYINLPNGKHHHVSDELMNNYLKEHNNQLPDYWLVPLEEETAKIYGFI